MGVLRGVPLGRAQHVGALRGVGKLHLGSAKMGFTGTLHEGGVKRVFAAVTWRGAACGSVMRGRKATLGSAKRGFTGVMGRNTTAGSVKRGFTEVRAGMLHLGVLRGFLLQ